MTAQRSSIARLAILVALACAPAACNEGNGDSGDDVMCGDAKCDDLGEIGQALATFNDPIATWLRANIDSNGQIDVAYLEMLRGISTNQGCDDRGIDSYIISDQLVAEGGESFPRVVNTVCSEDRTKADLAFFALSFANADKTDVDVREIEMFGWDATTLEYRFYRGNAVADSPTKVAIALDPSECRECHEQPSFIPGNKMPMTPIMNELSAPWQHWHAEPVSFDHSVPPAIAEAPNFKSLAGVGTTFRKSASRLETTIRSAYQQRVATARLRLRRNPANVDEAMSLLRPLFCDEQLTYATEDGSSGLLSAATVIDDGMGSVYFQIKGTGWPWEWWQDKQLRLDPPGAPDRITMFPIRGAAVVTYEKQLLSTRALTWDQVMRVRALDWTNPSMSSFRCELFTNAAPRIASAPPPFAAGAKNSDIFVPLLDMILTMRKGDFGIGGTDLPMSIPIVSPEAGKFVTLASAADVQALADALATGSIATAMCAEDGAGHCLATQDTLGAMIETRFKAIEVAPRTALTATRNAKACAAKETYPNAPHIGDLDCANIVPPDDSGGDTMDDTGGTDTGETGTGETDTGTETGEVGAGDCCTEHETPGCSNTEIESCVCAQDDVCCASMWDDVCVSEVTSFGCGTC
jgi:hypothetical protein